LKITSKAEYGISFYLPIKCDHDVDRLRRVKAKQVKGICHKRQTEVGEIEFCKFPSKFKFWQ